MDLKMKDKNIVQREKKIVRTSLIGIFGNIGLVAIKMVVGLIAGAVSIVLDAVNNLTDALSSLITIIGTKLAGKKPDKKHPYGHGKIEYLTSMLIGVIVLVAGGTSIYESIMSLIKHDVATYSNLSLILISVAILVKVALGLYFRKVAKETNSDALKGSGIDALFDAILSTSTLVGAIVSRYAGVSIEGYLGILIGLFILKSGFEILRDSVSQIIGQRPSNEISIGIKQLVNSHKEVIGAYDLILNNYGPNKSIGSIHIEVDDDVTAKELHHLTRQISTEVYEKFGVILTVGIYAANKSNPEIKELRSYIYDLVKTNEDITQVHGFYVDEEKSLVTFDIIVDYSKDSETIKNELIENLKTKFPKYNYYIVIDNDFAD